MICESGCAFTLQYDETGNVQNRKQCDILIRYWCATSKQVCVRFFTALMFGHAKGADVSKAILNALENSGFELPLNQLISIGSDGPNVNKTIWNYINKHMKDQGLHGLLPLIPCNLHAVHNAFRKGLDDFGQEAEQLVIDLFYFLKASPCRKEDYFETQIGLQLDEETFIKHVQSRRLTLIPATARVLSRWDAACKYFLEDLPKQSRESKSEKTLLHNLY